jgi:hypothetical protein
MERTNPDQRRGVPLKPVKENPELRRSGGQLAGPDVRIRAGVGAVPAVWED